MPPAVAHHERLTAPVTWWLLVAAFTASVWVAFWVSTPHWVTWLVTVGLALLEVAVLGGYGAVRVRVEDGVLVAGAARIEARHLGTATALEPAEARSLAGRDADARAYLLLRPYVRRAVRVEVTDPADPAPYWLVASRRPARLAAAVTQAVADAGADAGVDAGVDAGRADAPTPPPHRG